MAIDVRPISVDMARKIFDECLSPTNSHYLHHRYFDIEELRKISGDEFYKIVSGSSVALALYESDALRAICTCSRLDWDSAYFGMEMARLDCWAEKSWRGEGAVELLTETLAAAKTDFSFQHVCAHVAVHDFHLLNAMVSIGFRLMDVQNVYLARQRRARQGGKDIFKPRRYCDSDRESVLDLFSEVKFETRYTRDGSIPESRSSLMYRAWLSRIIDMPPGAGEVCVYERNGRIVAAGAGRYKTFDSLGITKSIMTDGVFASAKGFPGVYIAITRSVVESAWRKNCSLVELKVSASNKPANRSLQFLGYENSISFYAVHKLMV